MNYKPTRKVAWGPVGGAVGALLTWGIEAFGHVVVPAAAAIAIGIVATFVLQWFIKDARPRDEEE